MSKFYSIIETSVLYSMVHTAARLTCQSRVVVFCNVALLSLAKTFQVTYKHSSVRKALIMLGEAYAVRKNVFLFNLLLCIVAFRIIADVVTYRRVFFISVAADLVGCGIIFVIFGADLKWAKKICKTSFAFRLFNIGI